MPSLQDIAADVGVSVATVSAVLSDKADRFRISEPMRRKVRQAAQRLRYRPNLAARGLRTGQTYVIGLLFNNPRELIYAELLSHIQALLHHRGYAGICAFWETMPAAAGAFESVLDRGVDALITSHDDLTLIPESIPAVLLFQQDATHDCVVRDGVMAMRLAASHLLDLGHRRLGVFNLDRATLEPLLAPVLRERGFDLEPFWTYHPETNVTASSRRCMAEILALPPDRRPTALICRNDTAAMVAMSEAGRQGLTVPGDLSVIGFDAVAMGEIANPPLTSIGVAPAELARQAVELLIRRLDNPEAPRLEKMLLPELIRRASCAPPPGLNDPAQGAGGGASVTTPEKEHEQ